VLELDMVAEHVCWFEQRGSRPARLTFQVDGSTVPASTAPRRLRAALAIESRSATELVVRARNEGDTVWLAGERGDGGWVRLGSRWPDGAEGARAPLPHDVGPGEEVTVRLPRESRPGCRELTLDMVDEGIAWFSAEGSPVLRVALEEAR
jgi:hypothetical protein